MKACNRDTIFRHLQRDFIQSVFSCFYVAFNLLIVFICFCWYFIFEAFIINLCQTKLTAKRSRSRHCVCVCVFGLKMKGLKTWLFSADLMENQRNSCTFTAAMNLLILEHGSLDSVSFQIFLFLSSRNHTFVFQMRQDLTNTWRKGERKWNTNTRQPQSTDWNCSLIFKRKAFFAGRWGVNKTATVNLTGFDLISDICFTCTDANDAMLTI